MYVCVHRYIFVQELQKHKRKVNEIKKIRMKISDENVNYFILKLKI